MSSYSEITEVKRGRILRMNSSGLPQVEIQDGEIFQDVPMYYPAGLFAKPTSGDVIVFFLHADASLPICIPCGPLEEIPDIDDGESVIFNPMNSDSAIRFTNQGVEISGPVFFSGPTFTSRGGSPQPIAANGDPDNNGDTLISPPN